MSQDSKTQELSEAPCSIQKGSGVADRTKCESQSKSTLMASSSALLALAMESLPAKDKAAYLGALRLAPHLIESESNPEVYLHFDKGNPNAAAKRLAFYWKERKKAFGERAFRPLNTSSQGAFNEKDRLYLQVQHLQVLPSTAQGRGVLYMNRPRLNRFIPNHKEWRDSKMRGAFYALSCLAQNESTRQNGFVMLATCNTDIAQPGQFDRQVVANFANTATTAFPLRLHEFHFVCSPPTKSSRRAFAETIAPVALKRLQQLFEPYTSVVALHVGTPQELFRELQQVGLSQEGVPPCLGGTWQIPSPLEETDDRKLPPQDRLFKQQQDTKSYPRQVTVNSTDSGKREEDGHLDHLAEAATQALKQKEIHRREMGVVYSRRKRRRQKQRFESLTTLATQLQEQNDALKNEMQFLQATLTAVQINIALFEEQRSAQISSLFMPQQQGLLVQPHAGQLQQQQVLASIEPSLLLLQGLAGNQGDALAGSLLGTTTTRPQQQQQADNAVPLQQLLIQLHEAELAALNNGNFRG